MERTGRYTDGHQGPLPPPPLRGIYGTTGPSAPPPPTGCGNRGAQEQAACSQIPIFVHGSVVPGSHGPRYPVASGAIVAAGVFRTNGKQQGCSREFGQGSLVYLLVACYASNAFSSWSGGWHRQVRRPWRWFLCGEGILPLHFGPGRIAPWQSEAKMASRRKGGTPSPRGAPWPDRTRCCHPRLHACSATILSYTRDAREGRAGLG